MPLTAGTSLGPYQIDAPLGAGGMGEVYKATDTRLDRTVAIKVLPEHVANDPDLKQRFEREARTVAALNHPHICTLHDIGTQDGIDFLVMEYLDGQTLAQRLEKGALPLDQALTVAIEIADALDKAHRQGIVHRDLKPANIMLTKAGAKLLDFGLAKLKPADQVGGLSAMATQSAGLTGEGKILGTLQYMAPEQLEGKDVDARTDIFAFGAVIYEMVTGQRAFEGQSQASLIAAILERELSPMSSIEGMSPAALDRIVTTCLAKSPDARWQSTADVGRQLMWVRDADAVEEQGGPDSGSTRDRRLLASWPMALVTSLGAAIFAAGVVWWLFQPTPMQTEQTEFEVVPPVGDWILGEGLALSPDGRTLVYVARRGSVRQLFRRSMIEIEAVAIPGTEAPGAPFFSPDGQWVGFVADGALKKVALAGGAPLVICPLTSNLTGAAWGADDTIVFAQGTSGLFQVSADGGEPAVLTTPETGTTHVRPALLPTDAGVLFTVWSGSPETAQIAVLRAGEQDHEILVTGDYSHVLSTGQLLFERGGTFWGIAFDQDSLRTSGEAGPVLEGVELAFGAQLAVASNGTLAYSPFNVNEDTETVHFDRAGSRLGSFEGAFSPRISPDGRLVIGTVNSDLWSYDLARGQSQRVTSDPGRDATATWSHDSTKVYFASDRIGGVFNIFEKEIGTSRPESPLLVTDRTKHVMHASMDGRLLMFDVHTAGQQDLWTLSLSEDAAAEAFVESEFDEDDGQFSTDGRWVAYASNSSGRHEVYVGAFRHPGQTALISTDGGKQPKWRADGRELFFLAADGQLMAVSVDGDGDEFHRGVPEPLFQTGVDNPEASVSLWDVAPDGQEFFVSVPAPGSERRIRVVLNWLDELQRLVPTP